MKYITLASALVAFIISASALAQDTPETRAQVKAETAQARQAGQIPSGDLDEKPADIKGKSKAAESSSGLTRAEVKAAAKQAQREGDVQIGDLGKTQAEKDAARYAGAPEKAPKLHLRHKKDAAASATAQ